METANTSPISITTPTFLANLEMKQTLLQPFPSCAKGKNTELFFKTHNSFLRNLLNPLPCLCGFWNFQESTKFICLPELFSSWPGTHLTPYLHQLIVLRPHDSAFMSKLPSLGNLSTFTWFKQHRSLFLKMCSISITWEYVRYANS